MELHRVFPVCSPTFSVADEGSWRGRLLQGLLQVQHWLTWVRSDSVGVECRESLVLFAIRGRLVRYCLYVFFLLNTTRCPAAAVTRGRERSCWRSCRNFRFYNHVQQKLSGVFIL